MARDPRAGDQWQNLKTGHVYEVICVALDSEDAAGEATVIVYRRRETSPDRRIWARPGALWAAKFVRLIWGTCDNCGESHQHREDDTPENCPTCEDYLDAKEKGWI